MSEKPILFNTAMVQAILAGRKTQTRRPCKVQPIQGTLADYSREAIDAVIRHKSPYQVGDVLWVRETWQQIIERKRDRQLFIANAPRQNQVFLVYAVGLEDEEPPRWRPSIHMPRWAARLFLRVTDVRVQRVHEISESDAIAEGVDPLHIEKNRQFFHKNDCHALAFAELWSEAYSKTFPCASNPWVLAYTFERIER